MMFSSHKIFLDVKDYSRTDQLEADILQLGGIIDKFLSKEITCVITNRTITQNLLAHKDVTALSQSQSLRPACGNRVMSRGQYLLMRSNSLKDTSACDPVTFAQVWGIKVMTLDAVVEAIDRQLPSHNLSAPVTKQSVNLQHVQSRRKSAIKTQDGERNSRPFLTKFSSAFIKFEDIESNFRPFFNQYSTFPGIDLEGDLSSGIFKCAENIRPAAVKKNCSTAASTRKPKTVSKRGYCECCDVMYDDLNEHLNSTDHKRFAENVENFVGLDNLIDHISLPYNSSVLLHSEDTAITEYTRDMQVKNSDNLSSEAASLHLQQNKSCDHQHKHEQSDEAVNVVENCNDNHSNSEQTERYSISPAHVSDNGMSTASVNSENHEVRDHFEVQNDLHSVTQPVHYDGGSMLPTADALLQSVDSCKTNETVCNEKLCNMFGNGNPSRSDDTSQFLSSDYVVNLLELLSSENCLNTAVHNDEAIHKTSQVYDNRSSIAPTNSGALCCMPSACKSNTTHAEVLPNGNEQCLQKTTGVNNECTLSLQYNNLLDRFGTAATVEQYSANSSKSMTNSQHVSNSVSLPTADLSNLSALSSADSVALSESSLIINNVRNHNGTTNCSEKLDSDPPVLPTYEAQSDCLLLPPELLSSDQPTLCATTVTTESDMPVYAHCQVNNVCAVDSTSSQVFSSELLADSLDLHNKLLVLAYAQDIAEHNKQQSVSAAQASCPCSANCVNVSTSNNNKMCLSMAFSTALCFSDQLALLEDSGRAGVCTSAHTCRDSTYVADSNISTSLCHNLPLSGIVPLAGSACVNDILQSSSARSPLQRNTEMNVVSHGEADVCMVPQKRHLQINSHQWKNFEAEIRKSDTTAKCALLHGTEDKSTSADTCSAVLETRLAVDSSYCTKLFGDVTCSPMSTYSLQPEVDMKSSAFPCIYNDTAVEEADVDNDSASTLIYSCDCAASSLSDDANVNHPPDDNASETTVSNTNSMWKVVSCADCRMRLVRTEAVFPVVSTQNKIKVDSESSSVMGPELDDATELLERTGTDNDNISTLISCDYPPFSVLNHTNDGVKMTSETMVDYRDLPLPVSSTDSTWKVTSFVDCRMRLVRSNSICPAISANAVTSDSRPWYAKDSCNQGLDLFCQNLPTVW